MDTRDDIYVYIEKYRAYQGKKDRWDRTIRH